MDEEIQQRISNLAEKSDKSVEELEQEFEEKVEEVENNAFVELSEEEKNNSAISILQSDVIASSRVGSTQEVPILAIGHGGIRTWNDYDDNGDVVGDKDVLLAYGVIEEPDDGRLGLAVFVLDETEVNLFDFKDAFQTMNTLRGNFSVQESDSLANTYICYSSKSSEIEEIEPSEEGLPESRKEQRQVIHNFTDEAEIDNIAQCLSAFEEYEYEGKKGTRTKEWGADVKRINGNVVDAWMKDDGSSAAYTILDDSVIDPSELEGTKVMGENQRTPGLTAWCPPSMLEYGEGSQCEFLGSIEKNDDDGRLTMSIYGIIPLVPRPLENSQAGGAGGDVEEESI